MVPLTPFLQRKLVHVHKETRIKAQVVLLVLQTRRMHLPRHDVDVHMVHTGVRVCARFDFGEPVAAGWEERVALRGWWWVG